MTLSLVNSRDSVFYEITAFQNYEDLEKSNLNSSFVELFCESPTKIL